MKIAIDARAWSWTGIGRYTQSLLSALAALKSSHEFVVLLPEKDLESFTTLSGGWPSGQFAAYPVHGSYYSWQEQTTFCWQLYRIQADIWHFTHFNVPLAFRRPYVVTIHDTTRFIFPGQRQQGLLQQLAYEHVFASAVRRAQGVITVSHTTAAALQALPLALPGLNVTIYEGIGSEFRPDINQDARSKLRLLIGTNDPYLLYVGVWMSHKNLDRLLSVFARLVRTRPQLKLVLTGKPKPGYSQIMKSVQNYGLEQQVIFAGFVPSHLLPALYAEAICFVFPSLYEGFGLPPLEAQACGTPVVAANVASIPEVLGQGALYINPEYEPEIFQAINNVLNNGTLRQDIVAAGLARAAVFSWHTAAIAHIKMYEQAQSLVH